MNSKSQKHKKKTILKNKFSFGLTTGIILPILAYAIIYVFDNALISSKSVKITGNSHFLWTGFKTSTLILMAFCVNLIPTYFANKKYKDEFIRGIMIPTVVYCFIWFFYFKDSFF
ncbi:MAG: hypothetical protein MK207_13125 [Saprospiraceae bacterium]|nr:hypothetical protein [Saprospiraceae bacterium]